MGPRVGPLKNVMIMPSEAPAGAGNQRLVRNQPGTLPGSFLADWMDGTVRALVASLLAVRVNKERERLLSHRGADRFLDDEPPSYLVVAGTTWSASEIKEAGTCAILSDQRGRECYWRSTTFCNRDLWMLFPDRTRSLP